MQTFTANSRASASGKRAIFSPTSFPYLIGVEIKHSVEGATTVIVMGVTCFAGTG